MPIALIIVLVIVVLLIIRKEYKKSRAAEEKVVPVEEEKIIEEVKEEVKEEIKEEKQKVVKKVVKTTVAVKGAYAAIKTIKDLKAFARNSAKGADDAMKELLSLQEKIKEVNEALVGAVADRRKELLAERSKIKQRTEYLDSFGRTLENGCDNYEFLIKEITGEEVQLRKEPRFREEKVITVTESDVLELKERFGL